MVKDRSMPYLDWDAVLDVDTIKRASLALKSLEKGTASPEQQQFILNFLIVIGCRTYDSDWFPDERVSCFAQGRRHVGMQIVRFAGMNIGNLVEKQNG